MLTVDEIIEKMKDRKVTLVAQNAGIGTSTLYNLVKGRAIPGEDTLKKLSDYLEGR